MRDNLKSIIVVITLFISSIAKADNIPHYTCIFDGSVFVDNTGIYKAKNWESKGFSIKGDWVFLDSGHLKLKLDTNIQQFDILSGGEHRKGYKFSLENEKFIYVSLMLPLPRSWTVTGSCKKDTK